MSKTQAKSFTFRLPLDVYEVFMAKVGERDRSRFVVQALKQALGLTPEDSSSSESGLDLAARVNELSYRLELMKTEQDKVLQKVLQMETEQTKQDKVLQHLANLENDSRSSGSSEIPEVLKIKPKAVIQSQTESKTKSETEELGQKAIEYVIESKTKSETNYPTIENLLLLEASDNLISEGANQEIIMPSQVQDYEGEISHGKVAALTNMNISAVRVRHQRKQTISYEGIMYIPSGKPRKPGWRIEVGGTINQDIDRKKGKSSEDLTIDESTIEVVNQKLGLKEIGTSELLALLRLNKPDGNWSPQKLQAIRTSKKQKDLWHEVGDYKFKWTGKKPTSSKAGHLWWLKPSTPTEMEFDSP